MSRTIGPDQASTINGEAYGQVLDRYIMYDLIIATLQKGGIDRAKRLKAFAGKTGSESHRMLLSNADIECALRKYFAKKIKPGARWHGGGDCHYSVVVTGFLDQAGAENLGIARRICRRLRLLTRNHVEFVDAVIFVGRGFGRRIALALLRHHMDEHRAFLRITHIFQDRQQMIQIMPVDRTDIIEAQFLEQSASGEEGAGIFFRFAGLVL